MEEVVAQLMIDQSVLKPQKIKPPKLSKLINKRLLVRFLLELNPDSYETQLFYPEYYPANASNNVDLATFKQTK